MVVNAVPSWMTLTSHNYKHVGLWLSITSHWWPNYYRCCCLLLMLLLFMDDEDDDAMFNCNEYVRNFLNKKLLNAILCIWYNLSIGLFLCNSLKNNYCMIFLKSESVRVAGTPETLWWSLSRLLRWCQSSTNAQMSVPCYTLGKHPAKLDVAYRWY